MCEELHNCCTLEIACQNSGCGWTSSWNRSPVVRYLKATTHYKRPLAFCNLYGHLQEAPQYFECLLQTFLVVNGGKMIAGQQAGPIGEKSTKHYYTCIPGMYRTTATDINRPVSIY